MDTTLEVFSRHVNELAKFLRISLVEARRIIEQENKDNIAHPGRRVYNGFDYDNQEWCDCAYCTQVPDEHEEINS